MGKFTLYKHKNPQGQAAAVAVKQGLIEPYAQAMKSMIEANANAHRSQDAKEPGEVHLADSFEMKRVPNPAGGEFDDYVIYSTDPLAEAKEYGGINKNTGARTPGTHIVASAVVAMGGKLSG